MMRRFVMAVLVAATMCAVATEANAQVDEYLRQPHRFQVFVEGGISMPALPVSFKDHWNTTVPASIGIGYSVLAWLDINAVFRLAAFSNDHLASKAAIGYTGVEEVQGGKITTKSYLLTARFLAVPNNRTNVFAEVGVGVFSTDGEDLTIVGVGQNTMENTSGTTVTPGFGIQYALNDSWSAYTKYYYTINLDGDFAPRNLVLPFGSEPVEGEGDQQYSTIAVGIMIRM